MNTTGVFFAGIIAFSFLVFMLDNSMKWSEDAFKRGLEYGLTVIAFITFAACLAWMLWRLFS